MSQIIHKELSYEIIGAAMEIHKILCPGFLEAVYQAALAEELTLRHISFKQFRRLPVFYKSKEAGYYEADFVVEDKVILEIKAVSTLHSKHEAQAINYLTATGLRLAILINFGATSLKYKCIREIV